MISNKFFNNFANRGMALEDDINSTNKYYLDNNIAIIHKKPTPIRVSKLSYPRKNCVIITEAFYEKPSTTDYNGIYKGMYIDFDAKEIKNNKFFSIANIHSHQIEHLKKVKYHGGIAFIIVRFYFNNTTYFLEIDKLIEFIENETRKSIPIDYFEKNGYKIRESYNPRVDYLKVIDDIYFSNEVLYEEKIK